jgi:hypothetical protein
MRIEDELKCRVISARKTAFLAIICGGLPGCSVLLNDDFVSPVAGCIIEKKDTL